MNFLPLKSKPYLGKYISREKNNKAILLNSLVLRTPSDVNMNNMNIFTESSSQLENDITVVSIYSSCKKHLSLVIIFFFFVRSWIPTTRM